MGDRNFRLSSRVRPVRYDFTVTPDLSAKRFSAIGTVTFRADDAFSGLVLHGVALDVVKASIAGRLATVSIDAESQTLQFSLGATLPAGEAVLEVEYGGLLHDDLRGFYLAGGIGVTQFEAADARRVFPCFDEPSFKAPWGLAIVAAPGVTVISNGDELRREALSDGRERIVFRDTPTMSSYLVAMVVGGLTGSAPRVERRVPIRTWSVPEKAHLSGFGQECAAAVLPLLEDYFDRPYAFGKLDQVGIPDFEAGAMENSGCVTFREVLLLVDAEKSPLSVQKRVAEVITHELAHQWFGNLVTMQWWDDLWLNEAFATWMAYKIVDQWRPGWRMWDDFENGKHAALGLDAMASTHPIRMEVKNADEATENFDLITYEKGGAMLRMLEGFLGADAFRAGIRDYMKRHEYGNASAEDLWNALGRASNQPIAEVADGWITRGGYPLVTVEVDGSRVSLAQRRFFAEPEAFAKGSDETWIVPIVLKWADDAGLHETRLLLRDRTSEVRLEASGPVRFVFANAGGAGFYRVRYADGVAPLLANARSLEPVERLNLIADAWALFRAGAGDLATALDLLFDAARETDYTVLGEVAARLDGIDRRFIGDGERAGFRARVAAAFGPAFRAMGWDGQAGDSDDVKLRRAALARIVAGVGREEAAAGEAASRWWQVVSGERAIDPNLLDLVSVVAARRGDDAGFERFVQLARTENDPAAKRRALVALGSFESPSLVQRALAEFAGETVPKQDATTYLAALLGNRAARTAAWTYMSSNWAQVREKTSAPMLTRRLIETMGELFERRVEIEAWFEREAESLSAGPQAIRQTAERMRLDEEVRRRAMPALASWLSR